MITIGVIIISIHSLYSQAEIEYHHTPENIGLFNANLIDDLPYFMANFKYAGPGISRNETEIWSFDDSRFKKEYTIGTINDTLDHLLLYDFWGEGDNIFVFGHCKNNSSGNDYIYFSKINISTGEMRDLMLLPFDYYRNLLGKYKVLMEDRREWFFIEVDKFTLERKSIFRFSFQNKEMDWVKFEIPDDIEISRLNDVYYDRENELLVITAAKSYRHFLIFNFEFNYLFSKNPFSLFHGAHYAGPETLVLNNIGSDYQLLERIRPENQFIILQRNMTIIENEISVSEEYDPLNSVDDTYVLRKYQKGDFTWVHYSKSSINNFNGDYGFELLSYNQEGKIIKEYSIESDFPMTINYLILNEETGVGYGSGTWTITGGFQPFIFKIDLNDTLSHTDEVEDELATPILKTNLITDGKLRLIEESSEVTRLSVYDVIGREVINQLDHNEHDISFLPPGQYFLRYQAGKQMVTERFVKMD